MILYDLRCILKKTWCSTFNTKKITVHHNALANNLPVSKYNHQSHRGDVRSQSRCTLLVILTAANTSIEGQEVKIKIDLVFDKFPMIIRHTTSTHHAVTALSCNTQLPIKLPT